MDLKRIAHRFSGSLQISCSKIAKPFYFFTFGGLTRFKAEERRISVRNSLYLNERFIIFSKQSETFIIFYEVMTSFFFSNYVIESVQIVRYRCSSCFFVDWLLMHLRPSKALADETGNNKNDLMSSTNKSVIYIRF